MKFKVFGRMQSCPSLKLETDIQPLDFKTSLNGHFHGELGPFSAYIGEIPIRLTVPFLKRRPIMMSVGAFPVKLDRFAVNVEKAALDVNGTLGLKGIHASVDSKIDCSTDMDLKGEVTGKVGLSHLELGEEAEGHEHGGHEEGHQRGEHGENKP
jgi:hypothetical protein